MRYLVHVAVFCLCIAAADAQTLTHVRISVADAATAEASLRTNGYDVLDGDVLASTVDLVVSGAEMASLVLAGYQPQVIAVGQPFSAMQAGPEGTVPAGYPTLTQIVAQMNAAAAAFPAICQVVDVTATYGTPLTAEGRPLLAMKISDNVTLDEDEPATLIVACHHCREVVTPLIALEAIDRLTTQYGIDPTITSLVDGQEIWIAPVWNPDGYEYVFSTDNLWRKNRRVFPGDVGVDLNRNYDFAWDAPCGGSTNVSSNTYRGPSPESEAEIQAMVALGLDRGFAKVADFHSFGEEIRYGYGCLSYPFDADICAEAMAFSAASGYGGAVASSCCTGGDIHFHTSRFANLSMLWETADQFQPTFANGQAEAVQVWGGILAFLQRAVPLTGHVTDAVTGAPVDAVISFPGITFDNGEVGGSVGAFGRYDVYLPAGTFNVRFGAPGYVCATHSVTTTATGTTALEVQLTPAPPATGQPNGPAASFEIAGAVDVSCLSPTSGQNGPFFAELAPLDTFTMSFAGPPNQPFILLIGPLNPNNLIAPGLGSLDIGLGGMTGDFTDLGVVMDGLSPASFLDQFATLDANGVQSLSFAFPTLPPGILGTLQAVVYQGPGLPIFTAATEIEVL